MEHTDEDLTPELPFNNLYLLSGLTSGFNKAWMYIFTLILLLFGYLGYQAIITVPLLELAKQNGITMEQIIENNNLLFDSEALHINRNIVLLLLFGMFVFAFGGFLVGLKFIHKKTLTSVLTGFEKFRFKRFWFAFAIWATMLVFTVVLNFILDPDSLTYNFNLGGFVVSLLIMLVFMPLQTGLEEIVFRGYLLQGMSQVFKNGIVPLLITSILFGTAHISNPEVKEYGFVTMLSYYIGFALFLGVLTLLDEGIELAFGIHFANNIVSGILVTEAHSVIKPYSIFETKVNDPKAEIILWFCMTAVTFTIFYLKYRWKNFSLLIK
jgi:membrane protease YdiL (CAAX protease family)